MRRALCLVMRVSNGLKSCSNTSLVALLAKYWLNPSPPRETAPRGRVGGAVRDAADHRARDDARVGARAMSGAYDEVDLEDMEWRDDLKAYTYQCPCGDFFQITLEELRAGEDVAHCPSCSLVLLVIYDPEDLPELDEDAASA